MADNLKDEQVQDVKDQNKQEASKFRVFGKYFLIILVVIVQALLAYSFVDKNYEEIYGAINHFTQEEAGTFKLDKLVVNPAETNGHRYLLVELSLELATQDDIELLEANRLKVRHNLIEFLSSRTVDQLEASKKHKKLREELIQTINAATEGNSVRNLYFTKYVMQ